MSPSRSIGRYEAAPVGGTRDGRPLKWAGGIDEIPFLASCEPPVAPCDAAEWHPRSMHPASIEGRSLDQNPRERPKNTDALPLASRSINGLSLISSGRLLYLADASSDHFDPIGRK